MWLQLIIIAVTVQSAPVIKTDIPTLTFPVNFSQKYAVFGSPEYFTGETEDISCSLTLGATADVSMSNSTAA